MTNQPQDTYPEEPENEDRAAGSEKSGDDAGSAAGSGPDGAEGSATTGSATTGSTGDGSGSSGDTDGSPRSGSAGNGSEAAPGDADAPRSHSGQGDGSEAGDGTTGPETGTAGTGAADRTGSDPADRPGSGADPQLIADLEDSFQSVDRDQFPAAGGTSQDGQLAAERLADLQRVQAEYANYRKRVERDKELNRTLAVAGVLEAFLPALDDITSAREHGDLKEGPFAAIADKIDDILGKLGLERIDTVGEEFDPTVHDALLQTEDDSVTTDTVGQVLRPGYKYGDRVLRAAQVAVATPRSPNEND